MKTTLPIATLFVLLGLASAQAQAPGGGGGQGAPGAGNKAGGSSWGTTSGSKNGLGSNGSKPKPVPVAVVLRCYKDFDPETMQAALMKVAGVGDCEADAVNRVLRVRLSGGIERLEAAAGAASSIGVPVALLSPVRVSAWCQAKGKDVDLKALMDGAKSTPGLSNVVFASAGSMEAVGDFQSFDHVAFREMADKAGFDVSIKGFESITLTLSAPSTPDLEKRLSLTKGVLKLKADGDTIRIWAADGVGDMSIKDAVKAAGLEVGGIARKG